MTNLTRGVVPMGGPARAFDAVAVFRDDGIASETDLERQLLSDWQLRVGLMWGSPHFGHPEGRVAAHVAQILDAIEQDDPLRRDLRFLALVHDSFKVAVDADMPWSPENDHAVLARRFAERFIDDERLLAALELHDEPYWLWRSAPDRDAALVSMLARVPDAELFARFVELDAANEGKDLSFLWWFRRTLAKRGLLPAHQLDAITEEAAEPYVEYVKTFAVRPEEQAEVAEALNDLVEAHAAELGAEGQVLVSDDGLRVLLAWRWRGSRAARLNADGEVVRKELEEHPILGHVEAVDARLYRAAERRVSPTSA
jgi:hypothetical protein